MNTYLRAAASAALVLGSVSCGNVIRDSRAPVELVVSGLAAIRGGAGGGGTASELSSDVVTRVTSPAPCTATAPCFVQFGDSGTATFSAPMKNIGVAPTSNNQVTISRYHVEYARADGRNTPGIDVPYPFDDAVTVTIPGGGTGSVGFTLVRLVAKLEAPLTQLASSNNFITTIATVTFYGSDTVGNQVSASGRISVTFGNFADQ